LVESESTAGKEQFCELAAPESAELSGRFTFFLRAFALSWLYSFGLLQGAMKQQRDSLT
jgi:hypothetical protein